MAAPRRIRPSARGGVASLAAVTSAVLGAALLTLLPLQPASADTAPVPPATTPTVSADALPTVQVNGVVWSSVTVGNRVYATGSFTSARPAGSAAGSNETPRSNILAFDITTGALVTSWAPTLNGQGLGITASPDGKSIFVVGDFTTVNGVTRRRAAELDATTGALVTSFNPNPDAQARAVAVSGDTVYLGGSFSTAGGQPRSHLAAVSASTGALTTWAPVADQTVYAILAPANSSRVVVGGRFTTLNGVAARGSGAVDATTGATLAFPANQIAYDYGSDAAIYSLSTDGTNVYATGYNYLVNGNNGSGGNFESVFAATLDTGALVWVSGCRGDTYSSAVLNGVVYSVSHAHDCSAIGGHPQTNPWVYQRAMAFQAAPAADGRLNNGGNFSGRPAPQLLHWFPTLTAGKVTGQSQAAWSVTGNSQYVVLGGEFPSVNGTAQQGLVRFAVSTIAPNKEGPQGYADLTTTVASPESGRARVSWTAAYDRDNQRLTYQLLSGSALSKATVVATVTQDSSFFSRPKMFAIDPNAAAGSSQTYRIRVTDPFGNTVVGPTTTATIPAGTTRSTYSALVEGDGAAHLWRLGEGSGTAGYDYASADDLVLGTPVTRGAAGAMVNDTSAKSTTFSGTAKVPGSTTSAVPAPQSFAEELWFRTTTTSGGKLLGFGDSATGTSSNYDRHLYLTNAGKLVFGVYPGGVRTLTSAQSYNNGQWHHVVANLGGSGMELWVDGTRVGQDASTTSAQAYSGYWRVGGDNVGGWTGQPSSAAFAGGIEDVAVYPAPLTQGQVQAHYRASGRGLGGPNQPPTASFTSTASGLAAAFDGSGSSDADGSVAAWAWTFGDGTTGSGRTVNHTYTAGGSFDVTLTVTDDSGATAGTTQQVTVTPPANQPPTAAFTTSCTNLVCSLDASSSSDPDGTVASYSWAFGDGATGTGVKPSHTFPAAGTYSVALTVTDDKGTTASTTRNVTVTAGSATIASDAFARTVATGLGTADAGGAWAVSGSKTTWSVDGSGRVALQAGATGFARLRSVSSVDADVTHTVWTETVPTGGGAYLSTIVRGTSAGDYSAVVKILATGAVTLNLRNTAATLGSTVTVPGITYTAGTKLAVRVQASGSAPTTLRAKVWLAGSAEPSTWTVTATDNTAGYQVAGSVGFSPYLSGSATSVVVVRYDDLVVTTP